MDMEWLTLLAILLSPVIAVVVSLRVHERDKVRDAKFRILTTLMAGRHAPIMQDNIRALNMVDLDFARTLRRGSCEVNTTTCWGIVG